TAPKLQHSAPESRLLWQVEGDRHGIAELIGQSGGNFPQWLRFADRVDGGHVKVIVPEPGVDPSVREHPIPPHGEPNWNVPCNARPHSDCSDAMVSRGSTDPGRQPTVRIAELRRLGCRG
ncbi:MAG TPA: hypothetical protein VF957_11400, partial [Bradyrhizobium sp.]